MDIKLQECCRFCKNCRVASGTYMFCKIHEVSTPIFARCNKFEMYIQTRGNRKVKYDVIKFASLYDSVVIPIEFEKRKKEIKFNETI